MDELNSPIIVRVALVADGPRVVVLRSRTGRVLGMSRIAPGQPLLLPVPRQGALLDLLGTDVIGLPVVAGQQLTIVDG